VGSSNNEDGSNDPFEEFEDREMMKKVMVTKAMEKTIIDGGNNNEEKDDGETNKENNGEGIIIHSYSAGIFIPGRQLVS